MRILKYIFLLLLLLFMATFVYIATQKSTFHIEKSIVVRSPKSTLYNYINDLRNWETFGAWKKEDPKMTFHYPKNTIGNGASYSWNGKDGTGEVRTINTKSNELIKQEIDFNGAKATVFWTFKDSVGDTKITWKCNGTSDFKFKAMAFFSGGASQLIGSLYEKSLFNLKKTVAYEMNTYSVKVNGIVKKTGVFYIKQTITSKINNISYNLRILIPRMIYFFKKNNIVQNGNPFIIYHTDDVGNGISKLSVCIPIKEEIFISDNSDMKSGLLYPFQAVKTTLIGDYSHRNEAWEKTRAYLKLQNLVENKEGSYVEIYKKNMVQVANPSQWITEVFIPIKTNAPTKPAVVTTPKVIPVATLEENTIP